MERVIAWLAMRRIIQVKYQYIWHMYVKYIVGPFHFTKFNHFVIFNFKSFLRSAPRPMIIWCSFSLREKYNRLKSRLEEC